MQRPTSVTVFGVLNIIFCGFGLLGMAFTAFVLFSGQFPLPEQMTANAFLRVWTPLMLVLGTISTIALGISGIGLLLLRPWGRTIALGYAIYAIVSAIVGSIVQWVLVTWPMLEEAATASESEKIGVWIGVISGGVGMLISLIFPVLLWYFMTRPRVVAAFHGMRTSDPQGANFDPTLAMARRGDLSNPFLSPSAEPTGFYQEAIPSSAESIVEAFVPSKNGPALWSYYLGLFSLFPVLGLPLALAAIFFGVQGLRRVRENPAVRGGGHAWVGLICGIIFGLFNALITVSAVIGFVVAMRSQR